MAKKSFRKATAPQSRATRSDKGYPVEPEELGAQQRRIKRVAAAAAESLKASAAAPTSHVRLLPAPVPPQALAPLAEVWPSKLAALPENAATVAQTPPTPVPSGVKITFVLPEPAARRVSLCGEFNSWSPDATPLKRRSDGQWETTVQLAPGRYQYKFIVDGRWVLDPLARESVPNPHGTLNSVLEVRARIP